MPRKLQSKWECRDRNESPCKWCENTICRGFSMCAPSGACFFNIESGQKPTEEQLKEVEEAKKSPINFDEDCEELSPAMMKAFKSAVVQRNRKKKA